MKGGLTQESITGLKPGTYFANVIVTDAAGKKSAYQKATFTVQQGPAGT